jgi:hypothetical protein
VIPRWSGYFQAARRGARGDLHADVAGADHDEPPVLPERVAKDERLVERAQQMDVGTVGSRDGERLRARPGGDEELAVARGPSVFQPDGLRGPVDVRDSGALVQVDAVLRVEVVELAVGVVDGDLIGGQVVLRERRAVVRRVVLAAEEGDRAP